MSRELKQRLNQKLASRRPRGSIARGSRYWHALRQLPGGDAVLDLGAGRGELSAALTSRYSTVVAADMVPDQVRGIDGVEGVECDFDEPLPWKDGSFDAVAALDVVEHVLDPIGLLKETKRILRPGGFLVATTPNVRAIRHIISLTVAGRGPRTSSASGNDTWDGGHLHYFTSRDLLDAAEDAGFPSARIEGIVVEQGRLLVFRRIAARLRNVRPVREFACGGLMLLART